jgi:hypothetical protein
MQFANKFRQLEFVPKTFQERKKNIPEFETLYRSKSTHPGSIEQEVEKLKINGALRTYGKYINHVKIEPIKPESEEEKEQFRVMRSTSLTSFCRQGKRIHAIIQETPSARSSKNTESKSTTTRR